jgi:hypothetical protein
VASGRIASLLASPRSPFGEPRVSFRGRVVLLRRPDRVWESHRSDAEQEAAVKVYLLAILESAKAKNWGNPLGMSRARRPLFLHGRPAVAATAGFMARRHEGDK